MTTVPVHDPRLLFAQAVGQAEQQVAAVRPDELGHSTPCGDYDVRALMGHMVGVLHKLARAGAGRDARDVADVVDGVADTGWAAAFGLARREAEGIWADDALLDRMIALPWGTLPGRAVVDAYTHEFTVHSWDVARATGRLGDLDPALAVRALDAFAALAPPESRGGQGPFGPVVPVPGDADAYTRLAGYTGRQP
jgi:uncharacterized protein (TIGR03086 family)